MPDAPRPKPLTPTQVAGHLACQHLTQLDRQVRAGELAFTFTPDPRLAALRERGLNLERTFVERLKSEKVSIRDLRETRDPDATVAAMKDGVGAILQAPLANPVFFGVADVLLKVDAPSSLGAYSYEPIDTKLSRETKSGTILQLCTYCELLTPLQGLEPARFRVVTPLSEEHYRTADFGAYFRFVRARFEAASTAVPPPGTYPERVAHCDVCTYAQHCDKRRRADDHPSLIANIRTGHVRELNSQGVSTLSAFAETDGVLPSPPSRGSPETFRRLGHQARLQVRARSEALPPVDALGMEPGRGLARLPEPSPGDIFLDFEGDPFVGDQGLEYLAGVAVFDEKGALKYEERWSLDAKDEKATCEALLDFIASRLAEHPGLHVYHFAPYEPSALKRLSARYGTRGEALDRLLRGGHFIDLLAVVREAFRIGVESYGLKSLEVLHGFSRKLELRDAAIARRDLEIALEFGGGAALDEELRRQVADYNWDDCLSTASLRAWLEKKREALIKNGASIPRPAARPQDASEQVSQRDQRIQELKDGLTKDLPSDPTTWSDEHHGRALLAAMLGYFRQEEKNAWWEHFRLRDLPRDERLDEREMLADLTFVHELPKQGKEKNVRRVFRFQPQETSVDAGSSVFFTADEDPSADKATSFLVVDIDLDKGLATFSMNKAAGSRHPTAVFKNQVVRADALEGSLLAFAEHVRDRGFGDSSGPFAAAAELLLRRPPRRAASGQALRKEGEETLLAAKRLCAELDHGVLPIQGPPGSGKTYTGARAILELAKAGKRVGVTAVSHKVIDNLLSAVGAEAKEAKTSVRLVHKDEEGPPSVIEYVGTSADALAAVAGGVVVGGTAWLWSSDDAAGSLDYLFIDEAGQMALAQALAVSRATKNLILLGDPQQLDQPSKGAHPEGADVAALVHIVGKDRATLADGQGLFLDATYRLHPSLCAFTSELYYEKRLLPIAGLERQRVDGPTPFAGAGLFLVELEHDGNQALSAEEVEVVARIARSFQGTKWTDRHGARRDLQPKDLLVIAPYNAQVGALRRRLGELGVDRVGTVDKFQGQEAPVVVYSCTSSSPQDAPRGMPFLYDPHRFNVATSRAQGVVIVVASSKLFEPECRTPEQMAWANGLCRFREVATRVVKLPT